MCSFEQIQLQKSYISDIAVVGLIDNCILKDLLYFFLLLVQSKHTIPSHKIVDIHQVPRTETVLPQPLYQRLQLVTGLQMWRCNHLVLKNSDVLISIQLWRNRQLWYRQTKRCLYQHQHSKHHLLITLINSLVCLRVIKLLVIACQVQRCVSDQPELFILGVLMIIFRGLILSTIHGKASDHDCINYFTTLLHFFYKLLFFCEFEGIILFLGDFQRLEDSFLEAFFPVLIHEGLIFINDGIEACFVDFKEIVSDG